MPAPSVSYRIRRSARATRTRIIVSADGVEIVAPPNVPEHHLHRFAHDQQHWIQTTLAKFAHRQAQYAAPVQYRDGAELIYQGVAYRLVITPSKLKRVTIGFAETFTAAVPESLLAGDYSDAVKCALTGWIKQQARIHVERLVQHHAVKHRLYPRSITIKTQKSRWGSCGIHDDIHINGLLIIAPPAVLEYVVVHELCHIREKNHSARFWALVAEHLPDYPNQRRWLKEQGGQLLRGR